MNFSENRICKLLGIEYPIIQGGMIWCSGWELASAVSNAGGLGLIGSGSMYPHVLREHIQKCKAATQKPFGVNIPLLYPNVEEHISSVIELEVPIVFTSAGNPATYTSRLKNHGIKVVHVVSNTRFAIKAREAGADALVAEGFEAGGHNGREETTTLCLIPMVAEAVDVPVIAAGGIGGGKAMLAAMALGAEGVQVGSRFVASVESSAHLHFKEKVIGAKEGDTVLTLKEVTPVRLMKNEFYKQLEEAYSKGTNADELKSILGRGRSKAGMFEGNLVEGELEIGQVSAQLKEILPVSKIIENMLHEYDNALKSICRII
ncbi:MAG: NAD(P)H-dependent flavin oxidoreductase [Bacteroidota bacterium]|jgi:enoyl-[acyl-carrier protein] reductase II